jgi:hypothetical protein
MGMSIFSFSDRSYADEFRQKGYVHIKNAVSEELREFALKQLEENMSSQDKCDLKEWEIYGKKQQYLFEFPSDNGESLEALKNGVAQVTGAQREKLILSERHVHSYSHDDEPDLPPHKDRLASQYVSLIPLSIPKQSRVKLYPDHERDVNSFVSAIQYRDSLDEEDRVESKLNDISPLLIDAPPGDILIFSGSSIYHGRLHSKAAMYLTVKFNTLGLDPLAEDPRTPAQRQRSLEILEEKSLETLLLSDIVVSPRLHRISRHYQRSNWQEILQVYVWNENEFCIDEVELSLFKALDKKQRVDKVFAALGISGRDNTIDMSNRLKRLIRLGGIDILS